MFYMYRGGFMEFLPIQSMRILVFLKHLFAPYVSFLLVCKLFSSCAYQTTFLTEWTITWGLQKKKTEKERKYIMQPNINKKPEWIKTTPHTHGLRCCLTNFKCLHAPPAGKRSDARFWQLSPWAQESSGLRKRFFFCFLCRKRCGFDSAV